MKTILAAALIVISNGFLYSQVTYKFDTTATALGCSNILLQKISKNQLYELRVEISQIDSLPKSKEFDLTKYPKFIGVYLNKYPKGNNYVPYICNDVIYLNRKAYKPNIYLAKKGTIIISKWNKGELIISIEFKDLILIDNFKKEITLPSEKFSDITVGWIGG